MSSSISSLLPVPAFRGAVALLTLFTSVVAADEPRPAEGYDQQFAPFIRDYCVSCHGPDKSEASLDLSRVASRREIVEQYSLWSLVAERIEAGEMPPADSRQPPAEARRSAAAWIRAAHAEEARRHAGDPGPVLARRLNAAEWRYAVHDLTGWDLRVTHEFPVDPANAAGFDNSGESLTMSPELLRKTLMTAKGIADHAVFLADGLRFAPHPVVTDTDRDQYCTLRIVDFYRHHSVDLADYFEGAWQSRHGLPPDATPRVLSARYQERIQEFLLGTGNDLGPIRWLRESWNRLPAPSSDLPATRRLVRRECEAMRDAVVLFRQELVAPVPKLQAPNISAGSQPLVLWQNAQVAARRRTYAGDPVADWQKLSEVAKKLTDTTATVWQLDAAAPAAVSAAKQTLEAFCRVFPETFCVIERGPYFAPRAADQQRLLTAGFHLMQGYFRDDQPLMELILSDEEQRELDGLWNELDLFTDVPRRQFLDFIFFERAEPPRFMRDAEFDFARSEDRSAASPEKIAVLQEKYLAKATKVGASAEALAAMRDYFTQMRERIAKTDATRVAAEASHLRDVQSFAARAYRRPLTKPEQDNLAAFYRRLREQDGATHEDAIRDLLASVLLSPHFSYRFDLQGAPAQAVRPLDSLELASRLSFFLWSSLPDDELLSVARTNELVQPDVLRAQVKRMLSDARTERFATEFLGNWLDFRRFVEHNAVDRHRFPEFTPELRDAMYQEPIRYLVDAIQQNRPVVELVAGEHTYVNAVLARHYGLPTHDPATGWWRVDDASALGRGGLLAMSVFLTKNSPGLRTSPVKRGYWVVKRVLGERIPAPPPKVPELPASETDLGTLTLAQTLARHRADSACAGCHQRFDSVGLVFEGYGPIGERREKDLAGRPVDTRALFPDGESRSGLAGLREYLTQRRSDDFHRHLAEQLVVYALGRSLLPTDQPLLDQMVSPATPPSNSTPTAVPGSVGWQDWLTTIVTSRQFLHKRGDAP